MFAQRFRQIWPGFTAASRVNLQTTRRYAIQSRVDSLNPIYRPAFANLKKGSPEYVGLARSCRVWENFFKPGNIEPYLQAQSEFAAQSCVSMYCNLWNIYKVTSHYFSDCSLDQGTFKNTKWQSGSKCPSSHSTLKTIIASWILIPTGA